MIDMGTLFNIVILSGVPLSSPFARRDARSGTQSKDLSSASGRLEVQI